MVGNLTIGRERRCTYRDSVRAQFRSNHAEHGATTTATRTKVCANTICGVSVTPFSITITIVTVQPVEHHDRKFFQGAIAQNACRALGVNIRGTFLVALDPNGIAKGCYGIEADCVTRSRFDLGKSICVNNISANGLLEVNSETFTRSVDSLACDKPAAIFIHCGHRRNRIAVQE